MKYNSDIQSLIYKLSETQQQEFKSLLEKFKQEGIIENPYDDFKIDEIITSIDSTINWEKTQKLFSRAIKSYGYY